MKEKLTQLWQRYTQSKVFETPKVEGRGSMKVELRHGPISDTIGHGVATLTQHVPLWTPDSIFKNPTQSQAQELFDTWEDVPWKGDVHVALDNSPVWEQIKRTYMTGIKGRPNILLRGVVGIFGTVTKAFIAKFTRENYYNPMTKTATIFHTNKAVQHRVMGEAEFYDKRRFPGLVAIVAGVPGINAFIQWKATTNGMKRIGNYEEQMKAAKVMAPMFGYNAAADALRVAAPFVPREGAQTLVRMAASVPFVGLGLGHVLSRVPGVREHVTWALGGEKPAHAFSFRHTYEQSVQGLKNSWARLGRVFGGAQPVGAVA